MGERDVHLEDLSVRQASHVAGYLLETSVSVSGTDTLLKTIDSENNGLGIRVVGDGNEIRGAKGVKFNASHGIEVVGNDNLIRENDISENGEDGINIISNHNLVEKNDVGDGGKGNAGNGIRVVGSWNLIEENSIFANSDHGIEVSGGSATGPNLLKKEDFTMKLSIVIPVFNEASTIAEVLQRVVEADVEDMEKEIIVVDDGSADGTRELLQAFRGITLIFHDKNCGKGAAIRTGLDSATGDFIIVQDADLEYNPRDYLVLLAPLLEGSADVVYGSRFLGGPHRVLFFWHYVANRFLTLLSNMLTDLNLTDMETGYKAFRTEVLRGINLQSHRFGFEPEVTAKMAHQRCRIYEVPISYQGRDYAEGKKITWRDGAAALYHILKYSLLKGKGKKKEVPHQVVQCPAPVVYRVLHRG